MLYTCSINLHGSGTACTNVPCVRVRAWLCLQAAELMCGWEQLHHHGGTKNEAHNQSQSPLLDQQHQQSQHIATQQTLAAHRMHTNTSKPRGEVAPQSHGSRLETVAQQHEHKWNSDVNQPAPTFPTQTSQHQRRHPPPTCTSARMRLEACQPDATQACSTPPRERHVHFTSQPGSPAVSHHVLEELDFLTRRAQQDDVALTFSPDMHNRDDVALTETRFVPTRNAGQIS